MMEPIRILHVTNGLNRGGMESRIMDIYRFLDKNRYQYDFYLESGVPGAFDEEVRKLGGRVYYQPRAKFVNIPYFGEFRKFLRQHSEFAIIYAYNQWAGWYLKEAEKYGIPYRIAYSRTSLQKKSEKNYIKNIVKYNVHDYSTHQYAVSKLAGKWLFGNEAVKNGTVVIWPNAINTSSFAFNEETRKEVRRELGLTDEFTVIHVGNIRPEKNHPFLIDIFSEIKKRKPCSQLFLVGGGDYENIHKKVDSLSLGNSVHHLGSRSDVSRLLQAGDVFVFPSFYEGFPGAVLEAEASGLGCIVSDTVTDEVILTDHIKQLSISVGASAWAESAISFPTIDRCNSWKKIRDRGYDIHELVIGTMKEYDQMLCLSSPSISS